MPLIILILLTFQTDLSFAETAKIDMKKIIEGECLKIAEKRMRDNPEITLKAKADGTYDQVLYGQFKSCMEYMKEDIEGSGE